MDSDGMKQLRDDMASKVRIGALQQLSKAPLPTIKSEKRITKKEASLLPKPENAPSHNYRSEEGLSKAMEETANISVEYCHVSQIRSHIADLLAPCTAHIAA